MIKLTTTVTEKYCIYCLRKDPPVQTLLVLGENIPEYRWTHSRLWCNDCDKQKQAEYRDGLKIRYAEYIQQLHDDTVDQLTEQWNDPAFKKLDLVRRIVKVWDKYKRRSPENGVRRNWILEVIFKDLWFIDANGIIEEFYKQTRKRASYQANSKQYLLEFVVANLEMLREPFRRMAINRWDALVQAIYREYHGDERLVATPEYIDPVLNESVNNWYLLSRAEEQKRRKMIRDAAAERGQLVSQYEEALVQHREELTVKEKAEQQQQGQEQKEGADKSQ